MVPSAIFSTSSLCLALCAYGLSHSQSLGPTEIPEIGREVSAQKSFWQGENLPVRTFFGLRVVVVYGLAYDRGALKVARKLGVGGVDGHDASERGMIASSAY